MNEDKSGNNVLNNDAAWLSALFAEAERDLALLPLWARPVVTPHREQDR